MRKIRVLGHTYRVKDRFIPDDKLIHYGAVDHHTNVIEINTGLCRDQREETLLHELFHVLSCRTGANLSEKQVTAMSAGMYSVIKDNKKLL
jgi:Zn-dependent peptidase ImmA (M78 family)